MHVLCSIATSNIALFCKQQVHVCVCNNTSTRLKEKVSFLIVTHRLSKRQTLSTKSTAAIVKHVFL